MLPSLICSAALLGVAARACYLISACDVWNCVSSNPARNWVMGGRGGEGHTALPESAPGSGACDWLCVAMVTRVASLEIVWRRRSSGVGLGGGVVGQGGIVRG